MKITVLMSEYNTPYNELKESIESILKQTHKDFELLIIDDCSESGNLEKIVKLFNDNRIKVVRNEKNIGLAMSLNRGLNIASGDLIVRMDTDDIMCPDRLEKQINYYSAHKKYSIIGSSYNIFDSSSKRKAKIKIGEIEPKDFLYNTPFAHPTLLIVKKDLLAIGGYPNYRRGQDYAMEMAMYIAGYKGINMNEALIDYRQDEKAYKKKNYQSRIIEYKIRKKYFKLLGFSFFRYFPYVVKPLFVGLLPYKILKKAQRR